ncbi:hypothetical protein RchiOBHm_Chr5g0038131 [Rosa chinensis]|uniref:Uncharacterized protein n=1 Tax=Rosa chinensis TaxID=74649 RepID=A0A2P6QBX3_ROSCH|nr:hypothetical protein RchiOBHm_Chr5g0038131 [Rosa chinensis]
MATKGTGEDNYEGKQKKSITRRSFAFAEALSQVTEKNASAFMNRVTQRVPNEGGVRQLGPSFHSEIPTLFSRFQTTGFSIGRRHHSWTTIGSPWFTFAFGRRVF